MLLQIGLFLLQTIAHVLTACFLLRFYAFLFRINIHSNGSGLGQFIFALTDWAVLPLRRFVPRISRVDIPSLLPALSVQTLLGVFKSLALMGNIQTSFILYFLMLDTLGLLVSLCTGLLIVQTLLSWIQPQSSFQYVLHQFTQPFLNPLRKVLPIVGGIDLSPLAALLILQMISMVIQNY
jgi:YggT family protein